MSWHIFLPQHICNSSISPTDIPAASVQNFLLPAIQNLLKDLDALDPAHKEALEIILKERSGGAFDAISKVMGAHIGISSGLSSVSSFFGEGGLLGKKETTETATEAPASPSVVPPAAAAAEDTRFRRIMLGNFGDMLRGKAKTQEDSQT